MKSNYKYRLQSPYLCLPLFCAHNRRNSLPAVISALIPLDSARWIQVAPATGTGASIAIGGELDQQM
jgi:hypothetical protein